MKGLMVFLALALVASANARTSDKGIITDAIAMKKCLDNAIASIKGSVDNLLGSVNQVQQVITSSSEKLKACQAIGGDNPSAIQQIQQAACIMALVAEVQTDITNAVDNVKTSVNELLGAGDLIGACISGDAQSEDKNVIDDLLALKRCVDDGIAKIQDAVEHLLNSINEVTVLIDTNVAKFEECKALGAGGSIINQIEEARCIMGMVETIQADVLEVVHNIENAAMELVSAGELLGHCFV